MVGFFNLILVDIPSSLVFSVNNKADGGFLLNGQNLSVTKALCQWSL